jgi:hypothetical protein
MNPLDRLDPNRTWISHQIGACEPDCVHCRVGEGYTPEGLQIVERTIDVDVPGKGQRRVTQEVSRTGEVIFESWSARSEGGEYWVVVDNGFAFLARKLVELEHRLNDVRARPGVEPIERAQARRDRKAARQRLRRLADERSAVVVELDDAEERRLVRQVLNENPATLAPDDEIDINDAVVWLRAGLMPSRSHGSPWNAPSSWLARSRADSGRFCTRRPTPFASPCIDSPLRVAGR